MTDKELLELAAKAAGIELQWDDEGTAWKKWPSFKWNPLTDDGDALRLAVKLFLDVAVSERNKQTVVCSLKTSGVTIEAHKDDPCAATRRAIVRAAAEIGKSPQGNL